MPSLPPALNTTLSSCRPRYRIEACQLINQSLGCFLHSVITDDVFQQKTRQRSLGNSERSGGSTHAPFGHGIYEPKQKRNTPVGIAEWWLFIIGDLASCIAFWNPELHDLPLVLSVPTYLGRYCTSVYCTYDLLEHSVIYITQVIQLYTCFALELEKYRCFIASISTRAGHCFSGVTLK